jgi:hypothetical protein
MRWSCPNPDITAGLLAPFRGDRIPAEQKLCHLDRLHRSISDGLDAAPARSRSQDHCLI